MTSTQKFTIKFTLLLLFIFNVSILKLFAEPILDNEYNYSLDLPEGFQIENFSEDGMSYVLTHQNCPVSFVCKLTSNAQSSAEKELLTNLNKLKAEKEISTFEWSEKICAISSFSMTIDQKYSGWSVCAPLKKTDTYITLLCYVPANQSGYDQFIMSCLNSLCINQNFYNTPGIIITYAFPSEGKQEINIDIHTIIVKSEIDKCDEEAAQFVVDMEYSVLQMYAGHSLAQKAWERYYRMIYRDNFGRISKISEAIYNTFAPAAQHVNPENPDIAYAQNLLYWVQKFEYQRNTGKSNSDFTNIVSAICGKGNDCDSRVMLICALLKSVGIETIMLISPEYSHALVATEINAPGQTYSIEGIEKKFLIGETTAQVTWGKMAADQSDKSKYFPVILP